MDMLNISVISYKSTIVNVHRAVSLKYLRFPDQHIKYIKRNIDTLNHRGYLTVKVLYEESLPQE